MFLSCSGNVLCILKKKIDARIDAVSRMAKLGNIEETDTPEA